MHRNPNSNNQHRRLDAYSYYNAFYSINNLCKLFHITRYIVETHRLMGLLSPYRTFYLKPYDVYNNSNELVRQQERVNYDFPAPTVLAYRTTIWNIYHDPEAEHTLYDGRPDPTELPWIMASARYFCENYKNDFNPREVPLSTQTGNNTTIDFNGARSYTYREFKQIQKEYNQKAREEKAAAEAALTPEQKAAAKASANRPSEEEKADREERSRAKREAAYMKMYDNYYESINQGKPVPLDYSMLMHNLIKHSKD